MEHPVQITFRDVESSDAIKSAIEERVQNLERYYDKIESCRVVVEAPHRHRNQGRIYHVKIRLTVPGDEIVVSREPEQQGPHEDLHVAINDAFKETRRRLEDYVARRRRHVKTHEEPEIATVTKLFGAEGYGFIETTDGRELYFHQNAVLNGGFDELSIGSQVRFAEEVGDKGPQASTVVPLR